MARQWGYFAEVRVGRAYEHATHGVNVAFDSPVNGLFECAMTRSFGHKCLVYINGYNKPNGGYTGFHDFGFWEGVTHTRMSVEVRGFVTTNFGGEAGGMCRGRLIVREYDSAGTPDSPRRDWSDFRFDNDAAFTSYAYDSKSGAVMHTETFYGVSGDKLVDLEKGAADDMVNALVKDQHSPKKAFGVFSTAKSQKLASGALPLFDLKQKTIVPGKAFDTPLKKPRKPT